MAKLIVTSSSHLPRHRGGEVFSGAKSFEPDHFSQDSLTQIIADPVLTVVFGEPVTDAKAFLAALKAKPKAQGQS